MYCPAPHVEQLAQVMSLVPYWSMQKDEMYWYGLGHSTVHSASTASWVALQGEIWYW